MTLDAEKESVKAFDMLSVTESHAVSDKSEATDLPNLLRIGANLSD